MDMQMKSSVFKLLMAAFALFAAIDANAITLSDSILCDTSAHNGHYDHSMSSSLLATWDSLPSV